MVENAQEMQIYHLGSSTLTLISLAVRENGQTAIEHSIRCVP